MAGATSWSSSAGRPDAGRDARSLSGAEDLLPATAWGRQEASGTRRPAQRLWAAVGRGKAEELGEGGGPLSPGVTSALWS